jgi:hypothetical protein
VRALGPPIPQSSAFGRAAGRPGTHICEALEREGRWADWQIRQAEHALRIYFVHFPKPTDWQQKSPRSVVEERGHISPLAALEQGRYPRTSSS